MTCGLAEWRLAGITGKILIFVFAIFAPILRFSKWWDNKPVLLLKSNDDNCFPQRSEANKIAIFDRFSKGIETKIVFFSSRFQTFVEKWKFVRWGKQNRNVSKIQNCFCLNFFRDEKPVCAFLLNFLVEYYFSVALNSLRNGIISIVPILVLISFIFCFRLLPRHNSRILTKSH